MFDSNGSLKASVENNKGVKKMKKIVSLLIAVMLLVSAYAMAYELPLTTEPVTLKIAVGQHSSDAVQDFNTKYAIKEACEATGVTIEWIPILEGSTEQVSVMLAGNLPDVFIGLLNDTQIDQNTSLFVQIEDMIEENCPNILATYEDAVDGWKNFLTYPDGHIYGLMGNYLAAYNNSVDGTMWVNKVWLDNLGLQVPTTLEEFEAVLTAFRDEDADGDGDPANEIPMDFCQKHYAAKYFELAHCFGFPFRGQFYDIVDGEVLGTASSEEFRTFIEYYHYLTSNGLVNVEGLTQTEEQYYANLSNGKVGIFTGWAPYTYTSDPELQAKYVPVAPFSAEGRTFRVLPTRNTANRNCFVITSACKNPEIALQWWDYMSRDQEACHMARSGPEGLTWEMIDGVATSRVYTAEEATAFGFGEIAGHAGTSTFAASMGLTNCPPLILNSLKPVAGTTSSIRANAVNLYAPYFTEQSMSKGIVPTEAKEEFDFTCEGLEDFINAYVCDAILNGVTDDSWASYLNGLQSYNYDFYIEFYQNYLDGTL